MDANGIAMSELVFHPFDSRDALAKELAQKVSLWLADAIAKRGEAVLVVSGGSTPVPFFQALKTTDIAWENVTITVADERWVSPTHDDSTEKLVREHLLPAGAHYLSLAPQSGDESLEQGAQRLQEKLKVLPMPDVVVLGMGDDAHTASLFPQHPALAEGLNPHSKQLCLAVEDSPKPPPQRITLTASVLCHCSHLILHITGEAKKTAYETAMESGDGVAYPIAGLLQHSQTIPTIYWAA